MNTLKYAVAALVLVAAGWAIHAGAEQTGEKKMENRVFELRVYYANKGKMNDLHARFKDHTNKLLEKHGMVLVGFWTDSKEPERKLIYLVAHKSKAAADASWKAFGADPEWKAAKAKSEAGGVLVEKVDVTWLNPTEYSAMK
ncbi:MAG TPA: NIPSNAP family protein [Gemmataceae bacterium]|nr:NIPSNAP family protein [Gemmataceae bacterium]